MPPQSAAIRRALAGDIVVDPELALQALISGNNPSTQKGLEVLCAARDQATVTDIAAVLHLSGGTVKNHLSVVINKLGACNRSEAIRIAHR